MLCAFLYYCAHTHTIETPIPALGEKFSHLMRFFMVLIIGT